MIFPFLDILFEKKFKIHRIDIFNTDVNELKKFLNNLSSEKKMIIVSQANSAIQGKIKGFSSINLDYGSPINWHFNPLTGQFANKNAKWFNIKDFDPIFGDIKGVWEISRFTHFFLFVRAYLITQDIKYFIAFSDQLKDWLKNNVYSYGANYKCGQEASLRMINILISFGVFNQLKLTTKDDEFNVKKLVLHSYKKVSSNFFYAYRCIKNNHTISEITGLIIGSWCTNNEKILKKAYKLLNEVLDSQFMNDGGYIQFSFNYQRFAFQLIEFILSIKDKTKYDINILNKNKIKNSILQLYQLQDESGFLPNYGSNDGALIFPVSSLDYLNYKPILNSLYLKLTSNRLYSFGDHEEEVLWFNGYNSEHAHIDKIVKTSSSFTDSGLYSLRNQNSLLMIVLKNFKTRPAHMDQLHIDFWYKGVNLFCDSGTYSYSSSLGNSLTLTSAHNTVKVENLDQMKKKGHFFIYDWSKSTNIKVNYDHFEGTMISDNYRHTRKIDLKDNEMNIFDSIYSKKDYKIIFHTPCEVKHNSFGVSLFYKNQVVAEIFTKDTIKIFKCQISRYYLNTEEINCIIVEKHSGQESLIKVALKN
jgi:hypothetical protein